MFYARRPFLVAALLSFAFATLPAQAQSLWKQTFGYQMTELLQSPNAAVQETALQLVIEKADQNDPDITFWPAAEGLLTVYLTSPDRAHRQMAVAALEKLDDPKAYMALLNSGLEEADAGLQLMILQAAIQSNSIKWSNVATAYNELLKRVVIPGSVLADRK